MSTTKKNIDSTGLTVLYYVVQYFLIHVILLGTTLQPSIQQLWSAFNLSGIFIAVSRFTDYFAISMAFSHWLVFLLLLVPYGGLLAWECRYIIIYAVFFLCAVRAVAYFLAYKRYKGKIDLNKCVIVKCGSPGTGKSSSALWQAVEVSKRLWAELKYKYYLMLSTQQTLLKKGIEPSKKQLCEWREIKEAFEYYSSCEGVPCFYSNIPVVVDGKYANVLKRESIEQVEKIPSWTVLFVDEVGSVVSVDEARKNRPLRISDFFRLCRHFGEFRIICTEQDRENIYIDIRRVVADNEQMLEQKWVLQATALVLVQMFLKHIFLWVKWRWLGQILVKLNKIIRHIGFRQYTAVSTGNAEYSYSDRQKKRRYYLPTLLNCYYDDRTYRNRYLALNNSVHSEFYSDLLL